MPEASLNFEVTDQQNRVGPDLFGFYTREIVDLLTQDEDFSLFPSRTKEALDMPPKVLESGKGTYPGSSLFCNCMEDAITDVKGELLKASLRQSVRALTQEVDEMLNPVIRIRHIISCLTSKKPHCGGEAPLERKSTTPPCKRLKTFSPIAKTDLHADQYKGSEKQVGEVNKDLNFLLASENSLHLQEIMARHSDESDAMLNHMEQQLEELLDAVVSKCRLMTQQEKQQLRKLIQNLPPKNLDRIVELLHLGKPPDFPSSSEINVDLEEQENVTLWRLYFYVKAVENARKLSA